MTVAIRDEPQTLVRSIKTGLGKVQQLVIALISHRDPFWRARHHALSLNFMRGHNPNCPDSSDGEPFQR